MAAALQTPLGSGFGRMTSAAQAISGIDLSGKIAVVTGGASGIGLETARALQSAGAEVIVPARDVSKATGALKAAGIAASVVSLDLADLASVYECAAEINDAHDKIDILINNAGIMACPEQRVGPGWEMQFATNYIGHFVLTKELMPYLLNAGGARVICLSSTAHKRAGVDFDDIHFEKKPYDKWEAYGQSKTADALFAVELSRRRNADGVKAFSVHPGGIMTPLQRHLEREEMIALGWIDEYGALSEQARSVFKTPEQGAATSIWAATSPVLDDRGGEYCEDCDIAAMADEHTPRWSGVAPWAVDEAAAAKLWNVTEDMVLSA